MKIREFPEHNYKSIFIDGCTLRLQFDKTKPITELTWPEFYDVALNGDSINGMCKTGKCPYCYTSANKDGYYTENAVQKIVSYFGKLTENQRPFQVAIGGNGEPTEHPEIIDILRAFSDLGIVPNYTTNGVLLHKNNTKLIEATRRYCGGVAITYHPHLENFFKRGVELLIKERIKTNTHFVIGDKTSIDKFIDIYRTYKDRVDYFVILPYMNVGFAANAPQSVDYDYLEQQLDKFSDISDIAFGSNAYEWLKTKNKKYNLSLYEPESMSKYIVFENNSIKIFNNSFERKLVKQISYNE
jgi:MoaA/NifB/PqqE/SkfB family radical SAM enzyme